MSVRLGNGIMCGPPSKGDLRPSEIEVADNEKEQLPAKLSTRRIYRGLRL
jgi:hypothetical protein